MEGPPLATALVERGDCSFQIKNDNVVAAGYAAGIVFNVDESAGAANPCNALINMILPNGSPIPFVFVTRDVGFKLLGLDPTDSCETLAPAAGAPSHSFAIEEIFDGWGYVRLIHTNTMQEIDAFAIPEALDPAFEEGFGDLSVHEVAVDPYEDDLAYLSYYAGGIRVLRFDSNGMDEVGRYIDEDGNNFWGVEVHRLPGSDDTLILGSDRDSGLWIFRYTGD
jgi:hypothetical protein